EIAHVLLLRRRRRTNRTTIHSAPHHADIKLPVKPWIARQPRSRTHLPIKIHGFAKPDNSESASPDSHPISNRQSTAHHSRIRISSWTFSDHNRIGDQRSWFDVRARSANVQPRRIRVRNRPTDCHSFRYRRKPMAGVVDREESSNPLASWSTKSLPDRCVP